MKETLADIRRKLGDEVYKNEEHVRLSLVARVLEKLGWDIWNPSEVNTEFAVVPNEDQTRVDLALFLRPNLPAVYIETKQVGKVEGDISRLEDQLRDYNRNKDAMFSVLTDGRKWRLYYSLTPGEFSRKCFKTLDILDDDIDDLKSAFYSFLSKGEISNGNAERDAKNYLQQSHKQRAVKDALPKARRLINEPPYPSLPQAIQQVVAEAGFPITIEETALLLQEIEAQKPFPETQSQKSFSKTDAYSPEKNHPVETTPTKKDLSTPISNIKKISRDDLIQSTIDVLRKFGGKAQKTEVEKMIYDIFRNTFEQPWYQGLVSNGVPRWKHNLAWAKERAKAKGLIKWPKESGRGYWELTDKGMQITAEGKIYGKSGFR